MKLKKDYLSLLAAAATHDAQITNPPSSSLDGDIECVDTYLFKNFTSNHSTEYQYIGRKSEKKGYGGKLSNKQAKSRAKNKQAKKSRKKNRK